ncbi:hypothetical protein F2Q69_00005497 [Brassica cretica]|uniref:Uncharacterized protein n=1 Tax=Brassica cretica TaxID=69181 RepID=A0A8S9PMM8_BRACR|nr:hypothetical protein F2Q69_00005497 [Brassica cretica]
MNLNSGKHGMSLLRFSGDSIRSDRASARARSLRSDRAGRAFGRYIATELWLELGLGCYEATGQRVCVKYDLRRFSGGNSVVTVFDPTVSPPARLDHAS